MSLWDISFCHILSFVLAKFNRFLGWRARMRCLPSFAHVRVLSAWLFFHAVFPTFLLHNFYEKRQKACFGQPVQHFSTFLTPRTLLAELLFTPFWTRYFDDSSMFWVLFALFLNSKPLFSLPGAVNPSFDIFWTHLFSRFFKLARRLFSLPGAVFEWNWTLSESHFSTYFFMTRF